MWKNSFLRNTKNNCHENLLPLKFVVPFSRMLVAQLQCSHNRVLCVKERIVQSCVFLLTYVLDYFCHLLFYKLSVVVHFAREDCECLDLATCKISAMRNFGMNYKMTQKKMSLPRKYVIQTNVKVVHERVVQNGTCVD